MVNVRKTGTPRKLRSSHHRASSSTPHPPLRLIKQPTSPTPHVKRQRQKHFFIHRRRLNAFAVQRARRERWASIAQETQHIVLGDGKYVEEKPSQSSVSSLSLISPSISLLSSNLPNLMVSVAHEHSSPSPTQVQVLHDIFPQIILSKQGTTFYPHCSPSLADWRRSATSYKHSLSHPTHFNFTPSSSLTTARRIHSNRSAQSASSVIGVLSFASPKRAGGGFLHGGNEQEEALARSTSLIANLRSKAAQEFYNTHKNFLHMDGAGIHDHSMVYSPKVVVFRKDDDDDIDMPVQPDSSEGGEVSLPSASSTFIAPYLINVLSAVPVNAAAIRQNYIITPSDAYIFEDGIRDKMRDRMARALRIFELRGDRVLVLGAFGCGSAENKVDMVAEIWAELLVCGERPGEEAGIGTPAKFKDIFEEVFFAVPGKLYEPFKKAFEMRVLEAEVSEAVSD